MSIGIGGAGSKLASLMNAERATIVNVSESELNKTAANNKILAVAHSTKGQFKGAGKNPDVGKTAFISINEEIFSIIKGEMVVSSTGGGTGNGITSVLLDKIAEQEIVHQTEKTMFTFILPYLNRESAEYVENTIDFLLGPVSNAIDSGNTGNLILFSNKLKFEGRISEQDYNTMIISSLKNFSVIPDKGDELELLDGHIDHEDFVVYTSKPYFNHFCQFEYTPDRNFAELLAENMNPLLLPPEQTIEAMFLLEVPNKDQTPYLYNILDFFADDDVKPHYGVVHNPNIDKPIITLSMLYSRKPKELVDDFKQMADLMTRKKLKKSIKQFVKLEERNLDIDNEVRKIEEADEQNGNSVLDVLARLKKIR